MMQNIFQRASFAIAFAALAVACQPRTFSNSSTKNMGVITLERPQQPQSNVPQSVLQKWELMRALHPATLQKLCEPARYSPPAGVAYRGVAILFHGFSACPGQYENLAPKLALAGYEVLVPLFPGHGRIPKALSPRVDDVDAVPISPASWAGFTREMNEIAAEFKGEKVLVGLSLGSSIALRAVQLAPDLYDKVYLMSPKLRNETAFLNKLLTDSIDTFGVEEYILNTRTGWPICEKEEALPPHNRPGFCYMNVRHAVAMIDFGTQVIDAAVAGSQKGWKTRTQIQFALSHSDDGSSNNAVKEVLAQLHKTNNNAKVCVMPKEIPHSMFSLRDQPYEKPWLPALFQTIENFFVAGQNIAGSSDAVTDCSIHW